MLFSYPLVHKDKVTNRTRDDIVVNILQSVRTDPMFRTHIMYMARLSYVQLKYYQRYLLSKDLIGEVDGKWVITERGREYLKARAAADAILQL